MYINHLREVELYEGEEYPLGGVAYPLVLLRWLSHNGSLINRESPMHYCGYMEFRILGGWGVKAGVVAERSLRNQRFVGVNITLQNDFGVGGILYIDRYTLYELDRFLPDDAGEEILVHLRGQGCGGYVGQNRVSAYGNRHLEALAQTLSLPIVMVSVLVYLPVHSCGTFAQNLHPIHPDIPYSRFGVFGDNLREGDKAPGVFLPGLQYGKVKEICFLTHLHHLLDGCFFNHLGDCIV